MGVATILTLLVTPVPYVLTGRLRGNRAGQGKTD